MALIEKRSNGWRARVRKAGVDKSETFRTRSEAQRWATNIESEISRVASGALPKKTFGELLERYIVEVTTRKRGGRQEEIRLRRILSDRLANIWLSDLGPKHFADWRDRRLTQVSSASVRREMASLSPVCTKAFKEWQWLRSNPVREIEWPQTSAPRSRRWSDDEIEAILIASGYDRDRPPKTATSRVGAAVLFAIETAMRGGEICGLDWHNVDFDRRIAHLEITKNGDARNVPLSKEALRILRQLEGIRSGDRVFQLEDSTRDALFRKVRERAGLSDSDLNFHDTRREALTRLSKKVDVMTLAKISGHRDLRILLKTYYAPDMAEVADLLD
ncbi:site-specific integrase [Laribacter hongkongensis]|uniref:tyrosine-type recombinase/integrase n=1 Tax=Laribacter hongkongensis TaxID=168471 RepID=UPI001EFDEC71|nr:site-specific integrase [Laribacter hongkongensis]MCG9005116.1 site-specific integrase [Laribacter hongkongensis]